MVWDAIGVTFQLGRRTVQLSHRCIERVVDTRVRAEGRRGRHRRQKRRCRALEHHVHGETHQRHAECLHDG